MKTRKSTWKWWKLGESRSAIINCSRQRTKHSYRIWRSCFYGPKLDFMVKDALGRQWQWNNSSGLHNTNVLIWPTKDLITNYIDLWWSIEPIWFNGTIYSYLTRTHSRKFPLWLMPEQAIILSLSENMKYMRKSFRFVRKSRNSRPRWQQKQ
jgi:threonyl-tRNA synthetase